MDEFDDNGPGLPEGMEERIFEKFTRGEQKPVLPGVGLGLAICRAIIEAMAGNPCGKPPQGGARLCLGCLWGNRTNRMAITLKIGSF